LNDSPLNKIQERPAALDDIDIRRALLHGFPFVFLARVLGKSKGFAELGS
jgi:hypothetical protein